MTSQQQKLLTKITNIQHSITITNIENTYIYIYISLTRYTESKKENKRRTKEIYKDKKKQDTYLKLSY